MRPIGIDVKAEPAAPSSPAYTKNTHSYDGPTLELRESAVGQAKETEFTIEQGEVNNLTKLLKGFGLSRLESQIFVGLLRSEQSKAKDLSQQLGINRVEVYRILRQLVSRGLVTVTPSDPALFRAVHPKVALLTLIGETERRVRRMKEVAPEVVIELETLETRPRKSSDTVTEAFRLIRGDASVYEAKQIVARAQHSIQGIWAIRRAIRINAIDSLLSALDRGLKMQLILEITKECVGMSEVDELIRRADIRHCDGIEHALRFTIADGREAILGAASIDRDTKDDVSLWSGRKEMIALLSAQFDILWNKSEDGRERMKFLELGCFSKNGK
jgi:sugar-specific transcriptional regulator TrmB